MIDRILWVVKPYLARAGARSIPLCGTYRRTNHENLHVHGYKEEGTTTTPFDMVVLNEFDRFHLVNNVIDRVPKLGSRAAYFKQYTRDKLLDYKNYIHKYGEDLPEIRNWKWGLGAAKESAW